MFTPGVELRRISGYAFHGKWTQQIVELVGLKYHGSILLANSTHNLELKICDIDKAIKARVKDKRAKVSQASTSHIDRIIGARR